jgi:O-antigen/teichoic acid export membrane protein
MSSLADKIIRGSFFRILNPVLHIIVTFFLMPFVIRSIGDRWYGLWVLAGALIGYYGFLDLGLSIANERFISRAMGKGDQSELNEVFNTCLFLLFVAGILALIASTIIAIVTPQFVEDPTDIRVFRTIIMMIGFTMAFSFPTRAFVGFLHAHVRFDVLNIIEIIKLFLRTALILYFLGKGGGIITIAIISLGMEIFQMTIIVIYVKKHFLDLTVSILYFIKSKIRPLLGYSV